MSRPQPVPPGPGQESVWSYPRPPRLELVLAQIEIVLGAERIASTDRAMRVLETSHPPTYYLPPGAFRPGSLRPTGGESWCEWKGTAGYLDVLGGTALAARAGWTYPHPTAPFERLADQVAVYPAAMDSCWLDGEQVAAQPGGFYGGWITSRVVGPFKGEPGTQFW